MILECQNLEAEGNVLEGKGDEVKSQSYYNVSLSAILQTYPCINRALMLTAR